MPLPHNLVSMGSISAVIFEYTIFTMCKMWTNKNNTHQLKIPTKQLKAKSAITSHTKPNTSYPFTVSKQTTSATLIRFVDLQLHLHHWIRRQHSSQILTGNSWRRRFCGVRSARRGR
jgi:hypothetical protein